jgi:tetratricopeptide (TPR) repeat protein
VVEALKIYLNVLKRDPDDVEVLMAAGHISRSVNKLQNAEMFFNRVLEIEPWNLEASQNLEQLKEGMIRKTAAGF